MGKPYIICILVLNAVAVLCVYVPYDERGDAGKEVNTMSNFYSGHIPYHLPAMDLTTGELKLFAGHSMQFLKAKCPAVPKESLTQISKYIAKLVSKTNPVSDRSNKFDKLLTSISSCAMTRDSKPAVEEPKEEAPSFYHTILSPFIRIKGFFTPGEPETADVTTIASTDKEINTVTTSEPKLDGDAKIMGKSMTKGDDSESSENQGSTTRPDQNQVAEDANGRFFIVQAPNANEGDEGLSWNPLNWMSSIFHIVQDYFQRIFGADNVSFNGATVSYRSKRDVSPETIETLDGDVQPAEPKIEKKSVDKVTIVGNGSKGNQGKLAFLRLMDNLCRVYCSQCQDKSHIFDFKGAAKALLKFVYEDPTGVELAAKHYLDPAVFDALEKCQ